MTISKKEALNQAVEELRTSLGIGSLNRLWELTGVSRDRWYRLLDPARKGEARSEDIDELLAGVRQLPRYQTGVMASVQNRLYAAIGITVESSLTPPPPLQLKPVPPPPPDHFGGRAAELAILKDLCKATVNQSVMSPVVALQGMGGIGKTSIVRQLAHDLFYSSAEKIFEAVLWVDVTREFELIPTLVGWASYAEPNFAPGAMTQSQLALYVKALLDRLLHTDSPNARILVVFDDVWESSLAALRTLRLACPDRSSILITTRSEKVAVLLEGKLLQLGPFNSQAGVEMLQQYLPEISTALLTDLVGVLGGHPLALVLAARQILMSSKNLDKTQIITQQLLQYRKGLTNGDGLAQLDLEQGEDRNDNLRISFWYSYRELSSSLQTCFRALGATTYDQPYSHAMLKALWKVSTDSQAAKICHALGLISFLEPLNTKIDDEVWYNLHPLLHTYALGLLKENPGEYEEVYKGYEKFMIEVAGKFEQLPRENWTQLKLYLPHLQSIGQALEQQVKTTPDPDPDLLSRFSDFSSRILAYYINSPIKIDMKWLELNIEVSRRLSHKAHEALFLTQKGRLLQFWGEYEQAYRFHQEAILLWQELGQSRNMVEYNLHGLAYLKWHKNQKQAARSFVEQAITLAVAGGYLDLETILLSVKGYFDFLEGRYVSALECLERALQVSQMVTDLLAKAQPLTRLGFVYQALGDYAKSRSYFEQSLAFSRQIGDITEITAALNSIGRGYLEQSQLEQALECFEETLALRRLIVYSDGQASTLNGMGEAYLGLGQTERAFECCHEALDLARSLKRSDLEANSLQLLGRFYAAQPHPAQALQYFEQALTIAQTTHNLEIEATIYLSRGEALLSWHDYHQAAQSYRAGLTIANTIGLQRLVSKLEVGINKAEDAFVTSF